MRGMSGVGSSWRLWLALTLLSSWLPETSSPGWAESLATKADIELGTLEVHPESIYLSGPGDRQGILVSLRLGDRVLDVTDRAQWSVDDPKIARMDDGPLVRPITDGATKLTLKVGDQTAEIAVNVRGQTTERPRTFERDIMPLLSRLGCNSGPCHGKQRGQNGFQLSLLGFDPEFDFHALTREARGRRVFPAAPEHSLILLKATGAVPHGGGLRVAHESEAYELIRSWIADGMPRDPHDAPQVTGITVWPTERRLEPGQSQRLNVKAHYSDGSTTDVTHLSAFQSNASAVVDVNEDGRLIAGPIPGEAAISARFEGYFATTAVTIPLDQPLDPAEADSWPRNNFIDDLVWKKLETLELAPSPMTDETTFLRRAFLDIIGRLPTPEEVEAYLEDPSTSAEKRSRLIDRLLERPEYVDHWATKWMDLLRPNPYRVGIKAVFNLDAWIREQFRKNTPYDQFVRSIITAQGSTFDESPATIFRDRRTPDELTTMSSQLFLGIRLECAKCHHHPFEVWGQEKFYQFAAYFAKVGHKGRGLSPPISGSEEMIFAGSSGKVTHPRTGEVMAPTPLFGEADEPQVDPREALADWMTGPDNPYFARVIVNRVWADLMGVGLVEPVDDLRATNPPTNPALLGALAADFVDHGYDLKHLIRQICQSAVYGLASTPNERNLRDTRNYARHYRKRLRAEPLIDAICDVTGIPEAYAASPPGTRASQIWTHRVPNLFLDTFGRPDPNQDPPCERTADTAVTQALHLMNAPALHDKITHDKALPARLADSDAAPDEIVRTLYLATFSRPPKPDELAVALSLFEGDSTDKRRATEDLLWALFNSAEFLFIN